jgi:uncharacterized membrane protein (DUF4010 family)
MNELLWHRLAVALGIGLIVGLERGWTAREQHHGERLAGLRTFTLAGLLGGVLAAAAAPDRFEVLAAGALALGALIVGGYVLSARVTRDYGMTTELALLATFALGALANLGAPFEATAAAIVMALVLGFKAEAHRALERLDRREVLATLQLLAIAAILVPLLPARDLGPWQAVNPRRIGLLVLLIAGLSYLGYFAVRVLGARLGILLTAVFGGLSSSTAIAVAYARRAKELVEQQRLLGVGIALAAGTMIPRLAVEIAAVNRALLAGLWPTFAVMAAVPLVSAALLWMRQPRGTGASVRLANPLQLSAALGFGLALAVLFIAAAGLREWLGDAGLYAVAAAAGIVDVDAIGLTLADGAARGTVAATTAERAIVVAVLVNTAAKGALAAGIGGRPMLRSATAILGAALAAGAVTAALTLR